MYEARFGLSDLPFQISPDARFYVDSAPHRAALDALRAGLERGDEFMLLTGDFGAGKTTVARRLLEETARDRFAVAEIPGLRLEGDDVLDRIAESFGVRDYEARHRLGALIRVLEETARGGRQALLVIDEAHGIGLDSLRRLRKLTAVRVEGRGVLHVCLVGRAAPAGIDELARIGRPLAIGTTVHLDALAPADTRAYVLHRLGRVGWTGRPAFDEDVTTEIHACCEGNPARINRLCGHLLLQLYMQGREDTSPGIVRAVDALMRSEMEGEPVSVELPPPISTSTAAPRPREPDTILEPLSEPAEEESSVDIEALMGSPLAPQLPTVRRRDGPATAVEPWHAGGAPASRVPPRRRWMQVAAGVALFLGGGLAWQALSGRLVAAPEAGRVAATHVVPIGPAASAVASQRPPVTAPAAEAARIGAVAELALSTAPPAAGQGTPPGAGGTPPQATPAAPPQATPPAPVSVGAAAPHPEASRAAMAGDRARHRAPVRGAEERTMPQRAADEAAPAAVPAACSAAAETLSLCARPAAAEGQRAAPAQEAPAREPPREPAPRRPCDPTQAALGLCSQ